MSTVHIMRHTSYMYDMACSEMIHLMVLPNPDTLDLAKRPQHGGRDRHVCIGMSLSAFPSHHTPDILCIQVAAMIDDVMSRSAMHLISHLHAAGVQAISPLVDRLEKAGIQHTKSMSGRPAIFFRDPDANVLEVAEMGTWRE